MILNYNGQAWLRDCVGSALTAAKRISPDCRVVVLDNQSQTDDVSFIRKHFKEVEVMSSEKNDHLFSYNKAVAARTEEIIFFLNNDMRFDEQFAVEMMRHFDDQDVMAVTAKTMDWEGDKTITSRRIGYTHNFWFYKKWDATPQSACYSLDFCGGASAVRRERFLELGGFDRMYRPGYCEDLDLSYKAWRRGWKIVYEPRSKVYHHISATFKKTLGKEKVTRLIRRNEILFTLKHCGNSFFLMGYLLLLPLRFLRGLVDNPSMSYGILAALPRIPQALAKRMLRGSARIAESDFLRDIAHSPARYCFFTTDSKPRVGGIAEYLHQLCEHLAKLEGVAVEMRSTVEGAGQKKFAYPVVQLEPRVARDLEGKQGDSFILTRKWNTFQYFQSLAEQARKEISELRNKGTTVVIGAWSPETHFWCKACQEMKLPYLVICHGLEIVQPLIGPATGWRRQDLAAARKVIANSQATAMLVQKLSGREAQVVNPGVDRALFRNVDATEITRKKNELGIPADSKVLLGLGRMVKRKGFDLAIEAFAALKSQDAHMVLAGDGPETGSLKALTEKLGVASRVHFVGTVSEKDKPALYATADIFVMPNRTLGGADWEGFGIAFAEAALFGKPSIGGNNGGVPDAVTHDRTGLLVKTENSHDTAEAMRTLLQDDALRRQLGAAAKERSEKEFNWERLSRVFQEATR